MLQNEKEAAFNVIMIGLLSRFPWGFDMVEANSVRVLNSCTQNYCLTVSSGQNPVGGSAASSAEGLTRLKLVVGRSLFLTVGCGARISS